MIKDLQQELKDRWDGFTASEQKIASYMLQNIHDVPFETAVSLGEHVGVSAMTVGRFLRNLGYDGVAELKEALRGKGTWQQLYTEPAPSKDSDAVAAHLQEEIRALSEVHALVGTHEWNSVVKQLVSADRVSVASFQHAGFLGQGLAKMLQQVRPNVSFHSGSDGAYLDMLLDSTRKSCVVLIDVRRYFKQFRPLATEVAARGIPLVLITDTDCYWARELTPHVLMVRANWVWHSYSGLISLFSLLIASAIQQSGNVMGRIGSVNELRQKLVGYMGSSSRKDLEPSAGARKAHRPVRKPATGEKSKKPR
ncbi:MurR/RpiR family transcriptional regulator [Dyella jejuensis]|uniref:MurR/RpiR family transcriptional regulator n=1 Tax=Dyella jejuensis TaxID=1432009 RepID=A0ABW8JI77_9GAMM